MRIIVGMATMPGREEMVKKAIISLREQVDEIRVYDNSVEERDLTDNGKFYFLKDYKEPVYYFSCDDDIIYPPDYVEKTIQRIEELQCIVTYHGRKLRGMNKHYYYHHKNYSCLATCLEDVHIDVPGTGVTAFRTDYFNPIGVYASRYKLMADVVFALQAAEERKKIIMLKHAVHWIKVQYSSDKITIADSQSKKCSVQSGLANEIYKLNNESLI